MQPTKLFPKMTNDNAADVVAAVRQVIAENVR
jgi:hypothetical protein